MRKSLMHYAIMQLLVLLPTQRIATIRTDTRPRTSFFLSLLQYSTVPHHAAADFASSEQERLLMRFLI